MRPFRYERAADAAGAVALLAATPGATFLGGGTNLVDLMRLGVETPDAARRRHAAAARPDRASADGGGLRIGAGVRNSDLAADPRVRERYPVLAAGAARRRVGPAAQPGDDRRQPAAAHALRLLPGRHEAVQQARARAAAARRARASTATSRSSAHSEHCVATHPSDMAVALAALDARRARRRARTASATIPLADFHRLPGDEPERDTVLEHGELITAVELPPLPFARALALPQGARARVVRVRARLGRRRARRRRRRGRATCGSRSAASRTSRGGRDAAEDGAARRAARREERSRAPPTPSWPRRGRCATTPSRCRSRATLLVRTLRRAARRRR